MLDAYLGPRGFVVPKASLSTEELINIKSELTVTPYTPDGYGGKPDSFKNYLESESKIYLPKSYGLNRFGVPTIDKTSRGEDIDLTFKGVLRQLQIDAVGAVIEAMEDPRKRGGLLCLQCGQGKTCCAIYTICQLKKKTLVIVHKEFLLEQWKERIAEFAPGARVGLIKAKVIDVQDKDIVIASLQSLSMKNYDEDVLKGFGCVIIDECHHTAAQVFSQALKKHSFHYSLGLTATPKRKDGLTKVFTWYLGDILYGTKKRSEDVFVNFQRYYNIDPAYSREHVLFTKKPNIAKMVNAICEFKHRTQFIITQILQILAKEPKRRILILSDRRQHLHNIKELLDETNIQSGLYYGGMNSNDLKISEGKQVILGTFQYASEGFDVKGLDTLILATPKTDIIQVVGRILRTRAEDRVLTPYVLDIVDDFSVFPNQAIKRYKYYKSCKYTIHDPDNVTQPIKKEIVLVKNKCMIE